MKTMLLIFCMASLACGVRAEVQSVQVQNGQVRETPSFLGKVVSIVPYGQSVETLSGQGPWQQVRTTDGKMGWMHSSALTVKRINAQNSGGSVNTGASGDELALAGKGFNSDIEARFKAVHAEVDFTWVDKMSKMNASPSQIADFVNAGGLKQDGGTK